MAPKISYTGTQTFNINLEAKSSIHIDCLSNDQMVRVDQISLFTSNNMYKALCQIRLWNYPLHKLFPFLTTPKLATLKQNDHQG